MHARSTCLINTSSCFLGAIATRSPGGEIKIRSGTDLDCAEAQTTAVSCELLRRWGEANNTPPRARLLQKAIQSRGKLLDAGRRISRYEPYFAKITVSDSSVSFGTGP